MDCLQNPSKRVFVTHSHVLENRDLTQLTT